MILVKSLIILFIFILFAQFYFPLIDFLSRKFFDQREGFIQPKKITEEKKEIYEELKYTTASPLQTHNKTEKDAQLISELQEKMTDLLELNNKTTEINNSIKNIN
jgi:hypothetical protein